MEYVTPFLPFPLPPIITLTYEKRVSKLQTWLFELRYIDNMQTTNKPKNYITKPPKSLPNINRPAHPSTAALSPPASGPSAGIQTSLPNKPSGHSFMPGPAILRRPISTGPDLALRPWLRSLRHRRGWRKRSRQKSIPSIESISRRYRCSCWTLLRLRISGTLLVKRKVVMRRIGARMKLRSRNSR